MTFNFNENVLHLCIAGVKFDVDITAAMIGMRKISAAADALDNDVFSGKISVLDGCTRAGEMIDDILGEHAIAEIFKDREVRYSDIADIVAYINAEINAYSRAKKAAYMPKYASKKGRK